MFCQPCINVKNETLSGFMVTNYVPMTYAILEQHWERFNCIALVLASSDSHLIVLQFSHEETLMQCDISSEKIEWWQNCNICVYTLGCPHFKKSVNENRSLGVNSCLFLLFESIKASLAAVAVQTHLSSTEQTLKLHYSNILCKTLLLLLIMIITIII